MIASSSADPDEVLDHRAEVAVGDDGATGAVEHVGRDGVVAGRGDPAGDVFDVRVDAERLLDHDDRAARLAVGDGFVAAHRTVGRADDLLSRPHDSEPNDSRYRAGARREEGVMGFKVVVDFDKCESNALCMGVAPEVFEVRDDDFLYVLQEQPPDELRAKCEEAARVCPKQAITIEDA